jgi:hypothetical protein
MISTSDKCRLVPTRILENRSRRSARSGIRAKSSLWTMVVRLGAILMSLFLVQNVALAMDVFGLPKLDIGKGGQCVEDPKWMVKNHMKVLFRQRDETVHLGKRDGKYSLKKCVECHASTKDDSVIGRQDSFCEGCHRYEAVKIDCFECHSSKRQSSLVLEGAK